MSQSATQDDDRSDFPYARDATHSGRAIDVSSPVERPHPYARRPSLPMLDSGPRIQLHALGSQSSSRTEAPRTMSTSQPVNIPGISSLDMRDGPWPRIADRERYWEDRSRHGERAGDERIPMSRTASTGSGPQPVRLPSFHSLSSSELHNGETVGFGPGSSVMPPPPRSRTNPPSPRFAYARPTSPRHGVSHSLRPSYSSHSRSDERREVHEYPPIQREGSPPLRSIHTYESPGHYPPYSASHYPGADSRTPMYHGHHQRHPAPFADPRAHHPSYIEPNSRRQEEERPAGPGQSRRLAHLMSEQKRRESINTGFVGLRQVVPSASITDSKAVILRKAAAHIKQLESILANRQTGSRNAQVEVNETRYREVSDERDESTTSSTSDNPDVKMEREGTEEGEWRPSARN